MSQDKFLKAGQQFVFLDPGTRERRQFTIVQALGRGAFAQSFLASGEEGYAVLKSSVNAEGENIDLGTEAQVLCDLNHPNVVRYFGTAFDHQWRIVLAFERLFDNPLLLYNHAVDVAKLASHPGGRYHPLPVPTCLDLLMDLLCGLESMHQAGYVHADVKPANFMVHLGFETQESVHPLQQLQALDRGRGRGVLIDLGGSWGHEALTAHNAGEAEKGPQLTPLYAPPEAVLDDNPTPGGRGRLLHPSMDTYSAAMVFYLSLTGQVPYAHHSELSTDLLELKRHERRGDLTPIDPAAIQALSEFEVRGMRASELTARLVELLGDWLNPDPERRTTVSKARLQLEEAFDFAPTEAGSLRQRVATASLHLPRPQSKPRGRILAPRRPPEGGGSGRVTKRVTKPLARPHSTTRRIVPPGHDPEATPSPFSGRAAPAPPGSASKSRSPSGRLLEAASRRTGSPTGKAGRPPGSSKPKPPGPKPPGPKHPGPKHPGPKPPGPKQPDPKQPDPKSQPGRVPKPPGLKAKPPGSAKPKPKPPASSRPNTSSRRPAPQAQSSRPGSPPERSASGAPAAAAPRVRPQGARRPPPPSSRAAQDQASTVFWLQSPIFPRPFPLQRDRTYVLGRAGRADLPIPSDLISRCHASLSWAGPLLRLEDLDSTNGTTLSGQALEAKRPVVLRHGSRFSLGGFEIEVIELPRGQDPAQRSLDPNASTRPLKLLRPSPSS